MAKKNRRSPENSTPKDAPAAESDAAAEDVTKDAAASNGDGEVAASGNGDAANASDAAANDSGIVRHSLAFSAVYRLIDQDLLGRIASSALSCRGGGGSGDGKLNAARKSLNSAINHCGIKIKGFTTASRAPAEFLQEPVVERCLESDNERLLLALLRLWVELNAPLRGRIENHLREIGVGVALVHSKQDDFLGLWSKANWDQQLEAILDCGENSDMEPPDAALLLALVSGFLPAQPGELISLTLKTEIWPTLLEKMREIPPDQNVWRETETFFDAMREIQQAKEAELLSNASGDWDRGCDLLLREHGEELQFLELAPQEIRTRMQDEPELQLAVSSEVLDELQALLKDYRELTPRAATLKEERRRALRRVECEKKIFQVRDKWLAAIEEQLEIIQAEKTSSDEDSPPDSDALPAAEQSAADEREERNRLWSKLQEERTKREQLKVLYNSQKEDLRKWKSQCGKLEDEKGEIAREVKALKKRLESAASRDNAPALVGAADTRGEYLVQYSPQDLDNLKDAVDQAKKTFAEELLFALNSKSKDNSSFQRPEEVFAALAWLATKYRDRMMRQNGGVELESSLREVCPNWFYTPRQSQTTRGKFPDWYTTTVDSESHDLSAHIGRGKSHDAVSNIRIGFAWGGDRGKVIIGYIGRHQKTDRA